MIEAEVIPLTHEMSHLIDALAHEDPDERLAAATGLERMLGALLDEGATADRFVELASGGLLPALMTALGDPHKGVQVTAANCLQFLAYQTPDVIPLLREAMSGTPWRAWGAAIVLARMELWFPEMAGALAGALGSQDRDVRWAAANMLLWLGRKYGEAVEAALGALRAESPGARKMAAYCLGAMGEYADVEAALAGALSDSERDVRRAAVLALDKLPRLAPETVARIGTLREDPDEFVRRTAEAVAAKRAGA